MLSRGRDLIPSALPRESQPEHSRQLLGRSQVVLHCASERELAPKNPEHLVDLPLRLRQIQRTRKILAESSDPIPEGLGRAGIREESTGSLVGLRQLLLRRGGLPSSGSPVKSCRGARSGGLIGWPSAAPGGEYKYPEV
ncbi:hypothetical protein GOBAR_AA39825 [Gossypium barbadense]|uniref:Uncharacterized protein n=1 Tax=Gossypium barbadense TaxID=3634 RepID=A0A2P5VPX2_GOSBA|nr:hypothetical protein GOBAR_AA39825 [Gossypium barbadense]